MDIRKFSSIEQFRHVVSVITQRAEYVGQDADDEPIFDKNRPKPVLTFQGTVKLHGSNCGIAYDLRTGTMDAMSRERILSIHEDNHGFCTWVQCAPGIHTALTEYLLPIIRHGAASQVTQHLSAIRVYGEWCGRKINGKTGIGMLSERWVIFAILATLNDGSEAWLSVDEAAADWAKYNPEAKSLPIYFITDFPQFFINIDFNKPESVLDTLEQLTLSVEAECPVATAMGGSGVGEGIVWQNTHPAFGRNLFKTKGTRHKGTKSARLVEIAPEVLASTDAFITAVLTESRLEQGYAELVAQHHVPTLNHIGLFLKWIGHDVLKEESDTLAASGLERKQVMGRLNDKAKSWFQKKVAGF